MTKLKDRLTRLIATQGPVSISQFISLCLADPDYGYYRTAEPFGVEGDFITAPEISQMFGEMLGLWAIDRWQTLGAPAPFIFCEMGPGRGTLMDDMARTIAKLCPSFFAAAHLTLIETSHKLRAAIERKLHRHVLDIHFADGLDELPPLPMVLIANEFLDCLPIHQYCRTKNGYRERMIGLDAAGSLCFVIVPSTIDQTLLPIGALSTPMGAIIETSPAREACIETVAQHLLCQGGTALFIDYGSCETGFGDTLQALSRHQFRSALAAPGEHDLTSHVDFAALAHVAARLGCKTMMTTQGTFLRQMGIDRRAKQLGYGRDESLQQKLAQDVERLTGDQQMGSLFKILSISTF